MAPSVSIGSRREAHIGAVHGLEHGERQRARQTLAAIGRIGGKPLPAAVLERLVSFAGSPARR